MQRFSKPTTAFPWVPLTKWRVRDKPYRLWYVTVTNPNYKSELVRSIEGAGPTPSEAASNLLEVASWFLWGEHDG